MTKNEQIRQTLLSTREKRQSQILKVYELKVNVHSTSKDDFKKLQYMFVQTKWIQNDMIAADDIFHYEYKDHRTVKTFDKNKNIVYRNLDIQTGIHQTIIKYLKQDIITLSHSKAKGKKVGKLKFRRECSSIPLRTGTIRVVNSKTLSIPGFRNLKVYGLEQFIGFPEFDIADGKIIKKASGYYIKVSVCIPRNSVKRIRTNKEVGLDFGIKDNITTSDGEKFNCSVQESDHLKFLSRKLSKKVKGSKRYYKCLSQHQREYEHLSNKKNDDSNKLIAYLLKTYDTIYFQDEQISSWRKSSRYYARNIQHSYLGRIKAKLVELQKSGRSFEISKWEPSTKYCPVCGRLNDGITLNDRIFKCSCGYEFDRDVHAARNIKNFGSSKRAECLEQASAEGYSSTASDLRQKKQDAPLKRKHEAASL